MATTAISITKNGVEQRILFMTTPTKDGVDVDIHLADEEFTPVGTPSLGICEKDEESYHKELRFEAKTRKQFFPEFSTNPEWNPEN